MHGGASGSGACKARMLSPDLGTRLDSTAPTLPAPDSQGTMGGGCRAYSHRSLGCRVTAAPLLRSPPQPRGLAWPPCSRESGDRGQEAALGQKPCSVAPSVRGGWEEGSCPQPPSPCSLALEPRDLPALHGGCTWGTAASTQPCKGSTSLQLQLLARTRARGLPPAGASGDLPGPCPPQPRLTAGFPTLGHPGCKAGVLWAHLHGVPHLPVGAGTVLLPCPGPTCSTRYRLLHSSISVVSTHLCRQRWPSLPPVRPAIAHRPAAGPRSGPTGWLGKHPAQGRHCCKHLIAIKTGALPALAHSKEGLWGQELPWRSCSAGKGQAGSWKGGSERWYHRAAAPRS